MPTKTAPPSGTAPDADTPPLITTGQMRALHAHLRDHGVTGDRAVQSYLTAAGVEVEHRDQMTREQAARLLEELSGADVARTPGGLARALLAFQAEMPVVGKTKTARVEMKGGGSYSYTYADLAVVSAQVTPLLVKHGLVFTCLPRPADRGYELVGTLLHAGSGERLEGSLPLHGNGNQEVGGALTYLRRYLLGCLTGVITDDDNDAQETNRARGEAGRTQQWDGPTTGELLDRILTEAQALGSDLDTVTSKYRREHLGGCSVDDLDTIEPWRIAPLADQLRNYRLHQETVAADQAARAARAEAVAAGDAEPNPDHTDD